MQKRAESPNFAKTPHQKIIFQEIRRQTNSFAPNYSFYMYSVSCMLQFFSKLVYRNIYYLRTSATFSEMEFFTKASAPPPSTKASTPPPSTTSPRRTREFRSDGFRAEEDVQFELGKRLELGNWGRGKIRAKERGR